jgi:hypothetical protein
MSFQIDNQKGFKITYKNGYTVSVQFGGGNYCTNRDLPIEDYGKAVPASDTAELSNIKVMMYKVTCLLLKFSS